MLLRVCDVCGRNGNEVAIHRLKVVVDDLPEVQADVCEIDFIPVLKSFSTGVDGIAQRVAAAAQVDVTQVKDVKAGAASIGGV